MRVILMFGVILMSLAVIGAGAASEPSSLTADAGYPVATGFIAASSISEFERIYPDERELKVVAPEEIISKLVDKTIIVNTYSVRETKREDGAVLVQSYDRQRHLMYLMANGSARRLYKPKEVREGVWFVSEDKLIAFHFKSKDPDGATRINMLSYPLARFLSGIRHSKDGDYCQIVDGSTHAIVLYDSGSFSRRLNEACGFRY